MKKLPENREVAQKVAEHLVCYNIHPFLIDFIIILSDCVMQIYLVTSN